MSALFYRESAIFLKISTFTQSYCMWAVSEIFWLRLQFLQDKSLFLIKICRPYIRNPASEWLQISHKLGKKTITLQSLDMTSPLNFFDDFVFLLWILVTGLSFMSISWLVLELWQFLFTKDWPEIQKSGILMSDFCLISRDRNKLDIPNLKPMSLIECYWMLQNLRVIAFSISDL